MDVVCDRFLNEHDFLIPCVDPKHRAALARRAGGAPGWSPIVRGEDGGGVRDYLDGRPIHCGVGLELQAIEYYSDDYGDYVLKLPTGVRVRYELAWYPNATEADQTRHPVLYGSIGGYEVSMRYEDGMRFRWPL